MPWILWYLPTFFRDTGYRGTLDPLVLPGFVLGIFSGAIVLTWIYEGSGASVLLVALWHTCLNLGSATEAGAGLPAAMVTVLVIGWALVVSPCVAAPGGRHSLGRGSYVSVIGSGGLQRVGVHGRDGTPHTVPSGKLAAPAETRPASASVMPTGGR
jgi:hypothetical protein